MRYYILKVQLYACCHLLKGIFLSLYMVIFGSISAAAESDGDRYAGYYYPAPQSEETFQAPLPPLKQVSRWLRVGFVTHMEKLQKEKLYPPDYHIFARGDDAEQLIIIAANEGRYDTLFRLRALLSSMAMDARRSKLFAKLSQLEQMNFFDLIDMAGFTQLTISNGRDVSHRVYFE